VLYYRMISFAEVILVKHDLLLIALA